MHDSARLFSRLQSTHKPSPSGEGISLTSNVQRPTFNVRCDVLRAMCHVHVRRAAGNHLRAARVNL